ncbi:helix-turn-helix domain-containing protein [Streptomyces aureocirculatus]|uniref:LuxR C-terminal-related transcriptional regulator n=1 Tax=Streptomyces aureocirculatus TaxID=67275 RepID=UPI0006906E80|nr:LuxR C-terminal-related transcriptional regulator [Streptomyces aureocirculatus]
MSAPLTPGQIRVVAGLARGHCAARIAADLGISTAAVDTRIRRASARAGIHRRPHPQLVNHAYRRGYLTHLPPEPRQPVPCLTARLAQSLDATTRGLSLTEAAAEMGVTRATANTYRRRLYRLLGARTRAHAVALGWQAGLLGPYAREQAA